jgi:thiol:disulfide interchange protein
MKHGWVKSARIVAGALLLAGLCFAASIDPVQWTLTSDITKAPPGSTVPLRLTAKIDSGWHIYSLTIAKTFDGPIPTTASIEPNPAVASFQFYEPKPLRKIDPTIQLDTEMFENEAALWVPVVLAKDTAGALELTAKVRYAVCDDRQCLPPKTKTAVYTLNIDPGAAVPAAFVIPAGYIEAKPGVPALIHDSTKTVSDTGLAAFLLTAFGFGLAAIFTPCVFPMIPITVSFFLNQRGGFLQALVFSLGIIVLFCALGLGVTAAIGPFGVVQLGSNPWVNGFISVVFGAFALSLLGAFEITLPSRLVNKLDQASRRGGYIGTLLMGLTFSLTSFACVGPFVGPLLVSSVQAKGVQPVLGMMSFATGLASPFFFLAAFPSVLKKLPRSGGWLMRVKVVMGFVLLAAMLKYLSNVDQVLQLNAITRERFLAAWFVLFALAGLYLLGLLRLEGIEASDKLGIGRLLTAVGFLVFSFSLLPGMFGAPLGELDAYVPAAPSGPGAATIAGGGAGEGGQVWMKNQLREALDIARRDNKLVLVTFTGYACTNCHWMKANMFPRPEIAGVVKDLVLVELYTDGTDAASEENQKLEDQKFSTVSMPFYALLDPDEHVVATFPNATRNASEFLAFLKTRPS